MDERAPAVAALVKRIEAELKVIGYWQSTPPPPAAFTNMGPFGINTLTFVQWLQFVLIPRVRELIASASPFPASSSVASQAIRELDADPAAPTLVSLLVEFDELIEGRG